LQQVEQPFFVAQHFALTRFFKNFTEFFGVAPAIKDTKDNSFAINYFVVNCVRKNALPAADEIRNELNESRRKVLVNRFRQKGCRKNSRLRPLLVDHKISGLLQGLL